MVSAGLLHSERERLVTLYLTFRAMLDENLVYFAFFHRCCYAWSFCWPMIAASSSRVSIMHGPFAGQ